MIVAFVGIIVGIASPKWGYVDGIRTGQPTNVFLPLPVRARIGLVSMTFSIDDVKTFRDLSLPYKGSIGPFCKSLAVGQMVLFVCLIIEAIGLLVGVILGIVALIFRKRMNTSYLALGSGLAALIGFLIALCGFIFWAIMWFGQNCTWPPGYLVSGAQTELTPFQVLRGGWGIIAGLTGALIGGAASLLALASRAGWIPRNEYLREKGVPDDHLPDPQPKPIDAISLDNI